MENSSNRVGHSALASLDRHHSRDQALSTSASSDCGQPSVNSISREVEVIMRPHPDSLGSGDVHTRYLKTAGNATGNVYSLKDLFIKIVYSSATAVLEIHWYLISQKKKLLPVN